MYTKQDTNAAVAAASGLAVIACGFVMRDVLKDRKERKLKKSVAKEVVVIMKAGALINEKIKNGDYSRPGGIDQMQKDFEFFQMQQRKDQLRNVI